MKKTVQLLIFLAILVLPNTVSSQKEIQWVNIGEGTYDHGFIFPYKIKLYVPLGVRDIPDLKEGLLPMKFILDWLPIELSKEKVEKIFSSQLKDNFNDIESFDLSINIIQLFLKKLPKINKHDIWRFEYYPDEGTKFFLQDKKVYQLVGAEINRALIQSWINKNPMLTSNLFNRLLKVQ